MRICIAALLLGLAFSFAGCAEFDYPTKSRTQCKCQILDQFGTPVSGAKVSVVTTYSSPSVFHYGRMNKTVFSSKKFITSKDGVFKFEWVSSYKTPSVNIAITKPGYSSIHYFYSGPGDLGSENPRRLMLPKITGVQIPATQSISGGGGPGRVTFRTPWLGKPLYFDLETKSFVESGGDFEILVERADFGDTNKEGRPFSVAIKAIDGTLLPCPRSEYDWSFIECVPSWGTNAPILFQSPRSNGYPNTWTFFTFHTRNGKNVGKATMVINVISERKSNNPSIPVDIQAFISLEIQAFYNTEGSLLLGPIH